MPSREELKVLQALPLDLKIKKTQARIREWVDYYGVEGVYIAFSGGKDSTVLLDIARKMYPSMEAVFVNTGLEYPEIQSFVKSFDNVTIIRPQMSFREVIFKYGYPFIGKKQADTIAGARRSLEKGVYSLRLMECGVSIEEAKDLGLELPTAELLERYKKCCNNSMFNTEKYKPLLFDIDYNISPVCCNVIKKSPMNNFGRKFNKVPLTAQMTEESNLRTATWLRQGCNAFDTGHPISSPMSFWTKRDILQYLKWFELPLAKVYGNIIDCGSGGLCTSGCNRTGCIYCGFGAHLEKGEGRFELLKKTHPRQYDYCMGGGAYYGEDGLWMPTTDGLGMAHCIDQWNKLFPKNIIRY